MAGLGLATGVQAQTTPLPSTIEPGRIPERVEPRPAPPRPVQLPELREGAPEAVPDAVRAARIKLKEVRIVGASALSVEDLQAQADRYLRREITGSEIFELARLLTTAYRNAGYILSQVIVPPQSLTEGILTLRVIEGYIAIVRVEGDPAVASTLAAIGEKIKASRPLTAATLERYLLIANDLPGVQLRSVLSPSQTQGAADLTLIATVKRVEGFGALDNYGSKYLGPGQLSAAVAGNQLLGADDQWRFVGVTTGSNRELAYGQFSYSQVLNAEGLKLGASMSRARTRPGDVLEPFEVRGQADAGTLFVGYALLRSRNHSVLARALYDHRNVNTDMLGTRVIEDRIRALRAGLTWTVLDRLDGQNTLDVEYSKGVGGTGKNDLLKSRVGADGEFSKAAFDYERFERVGASYGLTVGMAGQWANEPLLSSEQFALGGRRFGRAYEPAELVGDRALAFRMEPAYLSRASSERPESYQLFAFYDVGKIWNKGATTAGTSAIQSLASAGIGSRMALGRQVTAALEVAWPLTRPVASYREHGNDARLLGSLVARF
jgi:hemolysin activation/secretion protein